jgi:hypothetical protein
VSRSAISLFTAAAFIFTSASCTTLRTRDVASTADLPSWKAKVTSVVMVSGERISFSPHDPGRVRGDVITGTATARFSAPVEIQGPFSSIKRRPDGSVYEITDGTGRVYPVIGVSKESETQWTILVNDTTAQQVSLRVSEVRQISFKKNNGALTVLAVLSLTAAGVIAINMALWRYTY